MARGTIEVKAKLWLEKGGKFILSYGRAEILRNIMDAGSISEAARSMNMSYSHAWSQVREMERAAGGKLVETSRGGNSGGGARLTDLGREMLERFDRESEMMERHLAGRGGSPSIPPRCG